MGLLNLIVLTFEILFYSMFMKFARNDGKFVRYLLSFTIITVIGLVIGTNNLPSYLLLTLLMLLGLKYIVKIYTSLYDMLVIVAMIIFGIVIQLPCYLVLMTITNDLHVSMIIYQVIKILITLILKNKLNTLYTKFEILWDNNNFYIRYLFAIGILIYTIASCLFIMKFLV